MNKQSMKRPLRVWQAGIIFALCGLYLLTLSGCWDRIEIEDRRFAVAMAVDLMRETPPPDDNGHVKSNNPTGYTITLALPLLSKDQENGAEIKQARGTTIKEALTRLNGETGKSIYLGQMKAMILGEALTENAVMFADAMKTLDHIAEIDRQMLVLAAEGEAAAILGVKTEEQPGKQTEQQPEQQAEQQTDEQTEQQTDEQTEQQTDEQTEQQTDEQPENQANASMANDASEALPGLYIAALYKHKEKQRGETYKLDFQGLKTALDTTERIAIPIIKAQGKVLSPSGVRIVRDGAAVGVLNATETRGLMWSRDDGCVGAVVTATGASMTVKEHKAKLIIHENTISSGINERVRLRCEWHITVTGETDDLIMGAEKILADVIANEMAHTAGKLQIGVHTDAYGLLESLRKQHYGLYRKYAADWERAFVEMEIIPYVTVRLRESAD